MTQAWDATRYEQNAHFVPALGQPVLELLGAQAGERILDLGCGDGVLTEKIVALGADVVGVDSSGDMVKAARARGIDARVAEGEQLSFDAEFHAVFSNAAMHWMKRDPDAVILSVRRALKPGGRFAAELGGHGCVAAITVALVAALERRGVKQAAQAIPWYFPTADGYGERLRLAGFQVEYIELIPRPTPLPTGMRGWLETFALPFTARIPEDARAAYLDEVVDALRPVLCDERGRWTADYMRLRFLARKR